uniref:ARAD1B22572p n=1 Tax=Blastobotrys adeninivorans TaxID=409370 RepID=A0A060T6V9_BLAAD
MSESPSLAASRTVRTPPKSSQQSQHQQVPKAPGFDDLTLLHCAGPDIEYPSSPTLGIKRLRGQSDGDQRSMETAQWQDYQELKNMTAQVMKQNSMLLDLVRDLDAQNRKLNDRLDHLEGLLTGTVDDEPN